MPASMPSLESQPLSSPAASPEARDAIVYVDESDDDSEWQLPGAANSPRPHLNVDDSVRVASRALDAAHTLDKHVTAMAASVDANFKVERQDHNNPVSPPSTPSAPLGTSTHCAPVTPQRRDIVDAYAADRTTGNPPRVPVASEAIGLSPGHRRDLRASAYPNRVAPAWVDEPTYYAVRGRRLVIFRSRYVTSQSMCN